MKQRVFECPVFCLSINLDIHSNSQDTRAAGDVASMSDSDDDIRVQAGNSRQVAAARRPARRAESRGSSVASSTATGTRGASASRAPSAPRALVPPAPSLSVLDEAGPSLSSDALLTSDGPTVATYNAHAVNKINGKTSAAAASTKSRPKPKRAALDPAAQKQLEQRRMQDEEEDDFFTRRATVNFRSKKPAVSKLDAVRSPCRAPCSSKHMGIRADCSLFDRSRAGSRTFQYSSTRRRHAPTYSRQ
jgi:hypothetical protein